MCTIFIVYMYFISFHVLINYLFYIFYVLVYNTQKKYILHVHTFFTKIKSDRSKSLIIQKKKKYFKVFIIVQNYMFLSSNAITYYM